MNEAINEVPPATPPSPEQFAPAPAAFTQTQKTVQPKRQMGKHHATTTFIFLVLIAIIAITGYMYYQTRQQLKRLSTPEGQRAVAQQEVKDIVGRLGKLTLLPSEDPVIATILDAKYLATQSAFYKDAQNGDKVVVYPKAQKAFIYSVDRNIIVNAGPLVIDQNQAQQQQVKIEIRNGTTSTGAGVNLKQQLIAQGLNVTSVGDALDKTYPQTMVIANNANISKDSIAQFAQKIGAVVQTQLPPGEPTSKADIVIIIGASSVAANPAVAKPAVTTPPTH